MTRGSHAYWVLTLAAMAAASFATAAPAATVAAPPETALCQGCHQAKGEGMPAAGIPRLAGQEADYLQKQLDDYASGKRENPVMKNWAKQLNETQRAAVSAYYASLTAPYAAATSTPMPNQLARGRRLAVQGDEVERVQACDNCHGPDGGGLPRSAPYLAGQSAEYLAAALRSWQQHTRHNDGGKLMGSVVDRLNETDIAALAAYFASLGASAE